jgi:hypothetical protein
MSAFFTTSESSITAGRAYLKRLKLRTEDLDKPVSKDAAIAELVASESLPVTELAVIQIQKFQASSHKTSEDWQVESRDRPSPS